GTYVGRLDGLRFVPDARDGAEGRMLIAAAGRVVRREVAARAHRLLADPDNAFAIDPTGRLKWRGDSVGRLVAGKRTLAARAVQHNRPVPPLPPSDRLAKVIEVDPALPPSFYATIGLRLFGSLAMRPDRLEKLAVAARRLARRGPIATGELAAISGISRQELQQLLIALGYRAVTEAGGESFVARPRNRRKGGNGRPRLQIDEGHPFAKL